MNENVHPPQFGLRSLFKLTTWASMLSAVYAALPDAAQRRIAGLAVAMLAAIVLVVFELVALGLCQWVWRSVRQGSLEDEDPGKGDSGAFACHDHLQNRRMTHRPGGPGFTHKREAARVAFQPMYFRMVRAGTQSGE
jgi:hypothetical protein